MTEKKCPNCNSVNPDGNEIHYCGMCGQPLETWEDNAPKKYTVITENHFGNLNFIFEEHKKLLKEHVDLLRERNELLERVNELHELANKLHRRVNEPLFRRLFKKD